MISKDAKERKATPIFSGVFKYFPRALAAVAQASKAGNDQHNPDTELHWDRSKSGDELDALTRHLLEAGTFDEDGIRHSTKVAWRAMANLEKELEAAAAECNACAPPPLAVKVEKAGGPALERAAAQCNAARMASGSSLSRPANWGCTHCGMRCTDCEVGRNVS